MSKMNDLFHLFETADFTKPGTEKQLITGKQMDNMIDWLSGRKALNYRKITVDGKLTYTWNCSGKAEDMLKFTTFWLERLLVKDPNKDERVKTNLTAIFGLGGHCDCEVVMNVGYNWVTRYIACSNFIKRQESWLNSKQRNE